jgi:hypothetical protein
VAAPSANRSGRLSPTSAEDVLAELDGRIAAMEEARDAAIAKANAVVDEDLAPLVKERAAIEEKLGPYFMANREQLLPPKRKSIELGGCVIGSRASTDRVQVTGDTKQVLSAMLKLPWAKKLLEVTWSINRAKVKAAIEGGRAGELAAIGVALAEGEETFFIRRTRQSGTPGKAG